MDNGMRRHLAAILALDVAGYSQLMGRDEQRTVERMMERRAMLIDPTVERHRGRVVKGTGDGILAEFASAQDAIEAAVAIQAAMAEANRVEGGTSPMVARIGVTIGDIFFAPDGDIFGDGVNIAARLESKAPSGGICVSARVLDDLRRIGLPYVDFGEIALKNIDQPVRIYCIPPEGGIRPPPAGTPGRFAAPYPRRAVLAGGGVIAVAGIVGLIAYRPWQATAGKSVAVIPFANLSNDPAQSYFSDGLSEEIRGALARNAVLKVAAPTSAGKFRVGAEDARAMGAQLDVAFLLVGSVRRSGGVVRIAAELIDARSGFSRWSQTFDRKLTDVFAVQSEIARVVAGALAVRVAPAVATAGGTDDIAAYDAFLRGQELLNADIDEASDRAALAQYDAAIAADSGYAAAYTGRSRIQAVLASEYSQAAEARELYDRAIGDARRAIELAPDLAAAHLALGLATYTGRLDVAAARGPYDQAAAMGAGDADVQLLFALYCARSGRPRDARAAVRRAMELDPINPRAFRAGGIVQYSARDYPAAIALWRKALALNPDLRNCHAGIGNALIASNRPAEARPEYLLEPLDLSRLPGLAIAEGQLGHMEAAQAAMAKLVSTLGDAAAYQQAQILAQWGKTDAAFAMLDRAYAVRDAGLLIAGVDPLLDLLRRDPRFSRLLSRLRLG